MAQTTIEQFATDLKMPPGALLEQLSAAGVAGKKQGDKLTEQDKTRLLDYLRKQHGAAGDGRRRRGSAEGSCRTNAQRGRSCCARGRRAQGTGTDRAAAGRRAEKA